MSPRSAITSASSYSIPKVTMIRSRSFTMKHASITCYACALLLCKSYAFNPYQLNRSNWLQLPSLIQPFHSSTQTNAAPKRGSIVDSYQTVSVNCNSCRQRLFKYKKKNGTKSNLIKCYVERIVEANDESLQQDVDNFTNLHEDHRWCCPNCGVNFARCAMIRGLPALKLVGGKTRMTKK